MDIATLDGETKMLFHNVGRHSPSDVAPHLRWTATPATPLSNPIACSAVWS